MAEFDNPNYQAMLDNRGGDTMAGTITRLTLACHPLLIVELWGWRVLLVGLVSRSTFLDLLRREGKL